MKFPSLALGSLTSHRFQRWPVLETLLLTGNILFIYGWLIELNFAVCVRLKICAMTRTRTTFSYSRILQAWSWTRQRIDLTWWIWPRLMVIIDFTLIIRKCTLIGMSKEVSALLKSWRSSYHDSIPTISCTRFMTTLLDFTCSIECLPPIRILKSASVSPWTITFSLLTAGATSDMIIYFSCWAAISFNLGKVSRRIPKIDFRSALGMLSSEIANLDPGTLMDF